MVCLTWAYQHIDTIEESVKQGFVDEQIREMENNWMLLKPKDEVIRSLNCNILPYNEQDYDNDTNNIRRDIERLRTEGFAALYKMMRGSSYVHTSRSRGKYWLIGCNAPFRAYGYPNRSFYGAEPMIKWLKGWSKKHTVVWEDSKGKEIEIYGEELGDQIRDYWQSHGNSLFYRFG